MKVQVKLKNNLQNQEKARELRDMNHETGNHLEVSFSNDLSEIILEGEQVSIPKKDWINDEISIKGVLKKKGTGYEIKPKDRGKTVNLHLDAELVAELEEIKRHVNRKTQHDIVLELFKKGLSQYKIEED